ncbi:hypothetical protein [Streptomyces sp. NRRL F-5122]|uniref:hypothetical protein n=1 Tax=Streptomyces sp. NRRL F-5122 TaxID=1609098 RepID=UPI00131D4E40|nr:hypothetical protein [Streptomyces sp. NRRL F-5122]
MTEHRDLTSNRFEFYTYRVGRSQLDRLFSIASEGFPSERIMFKTERSNTRLTRFTLEELVSAVATSPLPGDPNVWQNLAFIASDDGREISIDINQFWLCANISGPDATWVHGQTARLKSIVESVAGEKPVYRLRTYRAAKIGLLAGMMSAPVAVTAYQTLKDGARETVAAGTVGGGLVGLIVFLLGSSGKAKNGTLLSVTGEISDRRWWEDLSITDKIALGGLGVAALAAIATGLSAYADVLGS